ncbi:AAA family ATPase [Alteribacillus sp. JSM 102045]|uniref:AAA family ATPase n=1 Tax=Alteribacillus sp. JSM 102045 TaxID=1562101 RepID=UPI0035BFCCF0
MNNVNALSQNQSITFSPNLTLVYGENGSGKSGFSRLLSTGCVSRVLPNLKGDSESNPSAKILIGKGNEDFTIDF